MGITGEKGSENTSVECMRDVAGIKKTREGCSGFEEALGIGHGQGRANVSEAAHGR